VFKSNLIVGIDASRSRSGGAVCHLVELLGSQDPVEYGIGLVHLWAHDGLTNKIPEKPWLVKHAVGVTKGSLLLELLWQFFALPRIAKKLGVHILFNTDAGSVCGFKPSVTLNQDILSFDNSEINRYHWFSYARLRLELLKRVQLRSLKNSSTSIFLTHYARNLIFKPERFATSVVIPHGIDRYFFQASTKRRPWPKKGSIHCLYVSNVLPYKHQWNVVIAIADLRKETGLDLRLRIVGGGEGAAMKRLQGEILRCDPDGEFVTVEQFIPHHEIFDELVKADLFIFASSCEAFGITLLEAMASGIPIACSNFSSLPELIGSAASFFNPEIHNEIALAILNIINDDVERNRISMQAQKLAQKFTWERCASETWIAIAESFQSNGKLLDKK
jgi:glycosyltransferase involved in cell wall biosynthesis